MYTVSRLKKATLRLKQWRKSIAEGERAWYRRPAPCNDFVPVRVVKRNGRGIYTSYTCEELSTHGGGGIRYPTDLVPDNVVLDISDCESAVIRTDLAGTISAVSFKSATDGQWMAQDDAYVVALCNWACGKIDPV